MSRDAGSLANDGQAALAAHLLELAQVARERHGLLSAGNLAGFLADPACLRHPARLAFEFGEMAPHQFAQPEVDPRDPTGQTRVLYVHPALESRPDDLVIAVSYMVPVLNYGADMVDDEMCCRYGGALLDLMPEDYYQRVCEMADGLSLAAARTQPRCDTPCCPGPPSTPSAP